MPPYVTVWGFFVLSVDSEIYFWSHVHVLFWFFFFQQGVWETLLAALEILIRANHHQQMFNIKQLLKAQVVHHFLLTCQVLQVLSCWNPTFVLDKYAVLFGSVGKRLNAKGKTYFSKLCPLCFHTSLVFSSHCCCKLIQFSAGCSI